ncbi:MAG: hypothetical protein U0936_24245 [Planctomycetaceae bacterium]
MKSLQLQRDELARKVASIRRKQVDRDIDGEQAARMSEACHSNTGDDAVVPETIDGSENRSIVEVGQRVVFQFLLRKQAFVDHVEIDPETFGITLFDTLGATVPKDRLSEGEKQIFAISVLWGLAKASPRPLPAIIDTPMARLDSEHRTHLVERYFPNASHQVIILSTDAEVDETYYPKLEPFISHEYHLQYNEKEQLTTAEEGYFPSFRRRKAKGVK